MLSLRRLITFYLPWLFNSRTTAFAVFIRLCALRLQWKQVSLIMFEASNKPWHW
jgi:hypothetical protein